MSQSDLFDIAIIFNGYDPDWGQDHSWIRGEPHWIRRDPYVYVCTADTIYRYRVRDFRKETRRLKRMRDGTVADAGPGWAVYWDLATERVARRSWREVAGAPKHWTNGLRYVERGPVGPTRFRTAPGNRPNVPVVTTTDVGDNDWNPEFEVTGSETRTAEQRERKLVDEYRKWRRLAPEECSRQRITLPNGSSLMTDAYLNGEKTLVEAKSDVSRERVRTAIGQLYDYRRFLKGTVRLAVLVPRELPDDLQDLLQELKIAAIWRSGSGFRSTRKDLVRRNRNVRA
ncbi:MAG: hypothetical protein U0V73_09360 [Acidimicrobiia bacterium]